MKKSAKILVIAALIVSAIVMTSCSNLMTMISGKPSGTYEYKDEVLYMTYVFDGDDVEFKSIMDANANGQFTGKPYTANIKGKIKVNGVKATVKYENSTIKEHTLASDDRWNTFSLLVDDKAIAEFTKK